MPTLRAVAPTTGFYLRTEVGEQGGDRLRTYAASHVVEGELDFSPTSLATSTADVFAAARSNGHTALFYISPQQGQQGLALQTLRADLETAGTPVWMSIDDTGDYLARTVSGGGERRVQILDSRNGASARILAVDNNPLIINGQFTSINRQARLVLLTADARIAVVGCAQP